MKVPQVKRLPSRKAPDEIRVRFKTMDKVVTNFWDGNVQPEIDKITPVRADQYWDWRKIYKCCYLPYSNSPKTPTLAIVLEGECPFQKRWFPLSMTLVKHSVPSLHNINKPSSYLWFFSTAPKQVLSKWFGNKIPGLVGQASIENTILISCFYGFDGRIGLYAAPSGPGLRYWYGIQIGLHSLSSQVPIPFEIPAPPSARKNPSGNDGRFFYSDNQKAHHILSRFNQFR